MDISPLDGFFIRRTKSSRLIRALDTVVFSEDEPAKIKAGVWWIAYHTTTKMPVAYAGLGLNWKSEGIGFLRRVGVMKWARGNGLQRRLIQTREMHARRLGLEEMQTYTVFDNPASSNNLIRCGYKLFVPKKLYQGKNILYWRKDL